MGLDMYLKASRYVSGWDHGSKESRAVFDACHRAAGLPDGFIDEGSPSGTMSFNIGYWRKANAVHAWFVKNVQDGTDDCRTYEVSRERLQELHRDCRLALIAPVAAGVAMPTTSGFFFGSTEYDDGYREDLESTLAIIEKALQLPKVFDIEYRSSW